MVNNVYLFLTVVAGTLELNDVYIAAKKIDFPDFGMAV